MKNVSSSAEDRKNLKPVRGLRPKATSRMIKHHTFLMTLYLEGKKKVNIWIRKICPRDPDDDRIFSNQENGLVEITDSVVCISRPGELSQHLSLSSAFILLFILAFQHKGRERKCEHFLVPAVAKI